MTRAVPPVLGAARGHWQWLLLSVLLAVAGATCLLVWVDGTTPASPPPSSAPSADAGPARPAPVARPEAAVPGADRLRLDIARIGVSTDLVGLGLQDDGTVEVPEQPERAGWYRLGPRPGAQGSAVILGHVDSVDGPAVFANLHGLERGDLVRVVRQDGSAVRFEVQTVRTYANEDFPARLVYGSHGRRELNLVTCGGEYDPSRGGYQANVVVNALRV